MATEALAQYSVADFGTDVCLGLTKNGQKEIPSKYLYDEVGSALFDVITLLPEYGLFRADERLLQENARAIARSLLPQRVVVAKSVILVVDIGGRRNVKIDRFGIYRAQA
jgi:uncharacterized SAM-dependent methyltransferase